MLQLRLAPALEVLHASVGGEPDQQLSWQLLRLQKTTLRSLNINRTSSAKRPCGIPETDRVLNSKLVLKGPQWRGRVVGPILGQRLKLKTYYSEATETSKQP